MDHGLLTPALNLDIRNVLILWKKFDLSKLFCSTKVPVQDKKVAFMYSGPDCVPKAAFKHHTYPKFLNNWFWLTICVKQFYLKERLIFNIKSK